MYIVVHEGGFNKGTFYGFINCKYYIFACAHFQ